jgi:hypothetical protein
VLKGAGMAKQRFESSRPSTSPAAQGRLDGVLIFRAAVGVWLILSPWILPGSDAAHELSGALSGAVMMFIAFYAERIPSLRYLQALTGVWVMASAALLEPGPIMIGSLVTGHVILFSAAISRAMFTEEEE